MNLLPKAEKSIIWVKMDKWSTWNNRWWGYADGVKMFNSQSCYFPKQYYPDGTFVSGSGTRFKPDCYCELCHLPLGKYDTMKESKKVCARHLLERHWPVEV